MSPPTDPTSLVGLLAPLAGSVPREGQPVLAAEPTDAKRAAVLASCAPLEEESAETLAALIGRLG
jgi:hypothetical protein